MYFNWLTARFRFSSPISRATADSGTQTTVNIIQDRGTLDKLCGNAEDRAPYKEREVRDHPWMFANVNKNELVRCLGPNDIGQTAKLVTYRGGYKVICTYSWKQVEDPTIYVPGTPARWTPPDTLRKLNPDEGRHWIDQHAARAAVHQFEPLFQALFVANPELRFDDIDIVINRTTLLNLLKFVSKKSVQAFHFTLDLIGKTLFVGRKVAHAKGSPAEGSCGHNFEKEFTTEDPDLEDAEGHHRVLLYSFGGLRIIVRIEADAYVEIDSEPAATSDPSASSENGPTESIAHNGPHRTTVIKGGRTISQENIMELKSNQTQVPKDQMWFGCTPYCGLGSFPQKDPRNYARGKVEVKQMSVEDFETWEKENQQSLQKLVWLLEELRNVTIENGAAIAVYLGKDEPRPEGAAEGSKKPDSSLRVYTAKDKVGALPDEIVEKFWSRE
jgi:hypothetical protein